MILKEVDCIVVGCGPGGSTFAYEAAKKGLSVLALDKRQSIGEPVRCGEGVGLGIFQSHDLKIDPSYCFQKITGTELFSPGGKVMSYEGSNGYVVDRFLFDKMLAVRAANEGARVLTSARVTGVRKGDGNVAVDFSLHGNKASVSAPLVIGADGRESKVAEWLGIDTTLPLSDIAKGFQYDMLTEIKNPSYLKIYLGKEIAPTGYVWIFPKGPKRANIGIGVVGEAPMTAKAYLDLFIKSHGIKGQVLQHVSGTIPLRPPKHKIHADNFMMVGDAARFVNPIHGGGIHEAMDSGRRAAESGAEAVMAGDFSEKFLERYAKSTSYSKKMLEYLLKVKNVVSDMSDEDLDYLFDKIDGEFIQSLVCGKGKRRTVKMLMGRPSLLKYIPRLV